MDVLIFLLELFYIIFTFNFQDSLAQINFSFNNNDCTKEGDDLILTAEYTGGGTLESVNWYYSGQTSGTNVVVFSPCGIFGNADTGFPNDRLSYTCDTTSNIYTAKLSSVVESDGGKQWGVTFTITGEATPAIVKKTLTVCSGLSTGAIVGIVFGCLAFVGIIVGIVVFVWYKKK